MNISAPGWSVLPEAASRRPGGPENQARRAADRPWMACLPASEASRSGRSAAAGGRTGQPFRLI
ncbi:hypothetical protein [Desulfofustis glycolicus]|uniref:hypothetical protein n=1 Tax=Desulfofustis glycolicus TaxID=51195 RepID=UPI001379ADD9|nr:hypothetical protein [Desulfofustis glycolicus]